MSAQSWPSALVATLVGVALVGPSEQDLATFERVVAPFPVVDESGREFALPFLGGFDVPRPQFVDIDGDRDLDLFVQESTNALLFFENTGTVAAPRFEWRTDRYGQLEIGEWYRFVDVDADGNIDLLAELPFSHIRHYRNVGTASVARFEYVGPLRDSNGTELFLDRQNIPAIVDLDCDRRLDVFIGRIEGTVARYEADRPGGDLFSLVSERFEDIEIIGRIGGLNGSAGSMRHGANALAFADFDGDKDLDLFWGDFFEPGLLLIQNIGPTCSTPSFQIDPVLLPHAGSTLTSGYNAPAPVDLDLDGDLDVLMGVLGGAFNPVRTSADNFFYWERVAKDRFELRTKRFLDGLDFGSETIPAVGDIDGDRDLDLVVGNKIDPANADGARLMVLVNEGSDRSPRFRIRETLKPADAYHFAPALGDLDADGDLDMLVGTWNQDVLFLRNAGTARDPKWVRDDAAAIRPPRISFATPALGDVDGDRDLDLLLGQATGVITLYRNDGTVKAPRFVMASERLDDIRVGRRSTPALVDVDRDGRVDLVAGREAGGAAVYRNIGKGAAIKFVEISSLAVALPGLSSPQLGDLNGDGVLDVVSGTASGGLIFYRGK